MEFKFNYGQKQRWVERAGGAVLVLVLLLLAAGPARNKDLWMHLSVGRTLWQMKSIPEGDIFCYPSWGQPYVYFEWLHQVGLYLAYQTLGVYSFDFIKFFLWGGTLLFLYLTGRRLTPQRGVAIAMVFLAAFWLRIRISPSPDNFGVLFFSIYFYIITLYRQGGKNLLWLLPLFQVLWINIHLSAFLGPVLVGFALLDRLFWRYLPAAWRKHWGGGEEEKNLRLQPWLILLGCLILASLVTPYFHKTLTFITFYSRHQQEIRSGIVEWLPIYKFIFLGPYLLSLLLLLGSLFWGRRQLSPFLLLCVLSFSLLPFSSGRFIAYFALGALPGLTLGFSGLKDRPGPKVIGRTGKRTLTYAALLILLLGVNMFWLLRIQGRPTFGFGFVDFLLPRGAVDFLEKEPLPGRLFNHLDFSGYMEWRLYPRVLPFIDARHASPAVFIESLQILREPARAEGLLDKYGINYIVTRSCSYSTGQLWPLIEYLYQSPRWALIFADDRSLIFIRNLPLNRPWLEKYPLPKARIYQEVVSEIQGTRALAARVGFWDWTLAYAYYKINKFDEAKRALRRWVEDHPRDKEAERILQSLEKIPASPGEMPPTVR